jgi:hypothetical protein
MIPLIRRVIRLRGPGCSKEIERIVATRTFYQHHFPAPHIDAVESVIDCRVPVDKFSALAAFDGSVVVERTTGEVSAGDRSS